jgi:hypothetical protein
MAVSHRIREQFVRARRGELKRLCSVLGCGTVTTRLNGLCHRHNNLRVRSGHETQRPITLPRIRFYASKAAEFVTKEDVAGMVAALETVKRHADDFVVTHTDPQHRSRNAFGQPYTRRERVEYAARRELADTLGNVRDMGIAVYLVVGLVVIQEVEPSLIASDDAFLFQIARAVRRAGRPMQRGARNPVPTRAGVMVEAGRRIHEALGRVTLRLAREVQQQDEREHATRMIQRDEDEAREAAAVLAREVVPRGGAPTTRTVIDPEERRAVILAGLDAWLKQQPCRQQIAVLVARAQMAGLSFMDASMWAMKNGG